MSKLFWKELADWAVPGLHRGPWLMADHVSPASTQLPAAWRINSTKVVPWRGSSTWIMKQEPAESGAADVPPGRRVPPLLHALVGAGLAAGTVPRRALDAQRRVQAVHCLAAAATRFPRPAAALRHFVRVWRRVLTPNDANSLQAAVLWRLWRSEASAAGHASADARPAGAAAAAIDLAGIAG